MIQVACGKTRNHQGRPFTAETAWQHERDCSECRHINKKHVAPCGKTKSLRNVDFTKSTLRAHMFNCPECRKLRGLPPLEQNLDKDGVDQNIINVIDDNLPDGAFWAMYEELGG